MKRIIKNIICPYCNTEQKQIINIDSSKNKEIVTCDTEAGGCEKDFVVISNIEITINFKKIED